jgi:signal transduction histidine kinase
MRPWLQWATATSWLVAAVTLAVSLAMIGSPELETRYGPDLIVVGVKNDNWHQDLRPGDVIIAVDGRTVTTADDIRQVLRERDLALPRRVAVLRRGARREFTVLAHRLTPRDWLADNLAILVYGLAFLIAATLLVARQAAGPVAEAFVGMALLTGSYAVNGVAYLTAQALWPLTVILQPLQCMGLIAFGLALRHPDRRRRWPWRLGALLAIGLLATYTPRGPGLASLTGVFAWHHALTTTGLAGAALVSIVTFWVLLVLALRRSERFSEHRQQVKIILASAIVALVPLCGIWLVALILGRQPWEPVAALALVATGVMPLATSAALLRLRLVDLERTVRLILTHTLTAGGLGGVYFGAYLGLSALGGSSLVRAEWQFVLLVALAIAFEPAARGVGRSLDRFLYGDRWEVTEMLRRIRGYGAFDWSQDELLVQIAGDVAEAAQLRAVAVALPADAGWRIAADQDGAGAKGAALLGARPEKTPFWAADDRDLGGFRAAIPLTLSGRPVSLLLLGDRRDGVPLSEIDLRYVTLFLAPLSGMIGYARSRDRQRDAETAIAALYDQIGQVNLAVLHQSADAWGDSDLDGPLRQIVAQAGQLLEGAHGALDTVQRRRIALIHRHALRLERAIADTDALQALLAGRAIPDRVSVDVGALLSQAWERVWQQADLMDACLVINDGPALMVKSDPDRLTRVLEHVLDNAVTHGPAGGEVTCHWAVDGGYLALSIRDAGPGVSQARLQVLQTAPSALLEPDAQRQGRLGIGLALVHATVAALGGMVQLESGAQGTTVTLRLPLADPG